MEAVMMPRTQNEKQAMNPYRQIRNEKRNNRSRPTENFGGLYLPHPYQSYSFPPPENPIFQSPQQPPLLPLPISVRPNRTTSLTPKKPKQPMKRREGPKHTTSKPSGPDRSEQIQLPYDLDKFSGSVFTLSPPPSSLPLPKFLPRRKLSCKAEAAGVDTGAPDNLRQMLRLR